ncbi:MAG: carboxypeptidase regulatory-like domain-containing protein [Terracidiphilus sp.]|nr:carboxypeptidase regulatory-like domain-containing protein [Terracidiphilus sp.]
MQQFTGHVFDSTGAVIAGAEVVVLNQGTGVETRTLTTGQGVYAVPYLIPGTYTVTASKAGFAPQKKTDIRLDVDQTSTIDITLQVGAENQVVTVDGSALQVEFTKADFGEVVDRERIEELPMDGQNVSNLFILSPGARDYSQPIFARTFDRVAMNHYVNGEPNPPSNTVDGITVDTESQGQVAFVPPASSVEAFKVVLSAYDASYGQGGSSVDMSLKSGTNKFHGGVEYFGRRTWLNAYGYEDKYADPTDPTRAPLKRNDYSLELDGPVIIPHLYNGKKKLFYIVTYEQMRDIQPDLNWYFYSAPNPAWLTGDFSTATYWNTTTNSEAPLTIYDPLTPLQEIVDPLDGKTKLAHSAFPGNKIPANRIDSVGAKILSYLSGVKPNMDMGPGNAAWTNNYRCQGTENALWKSGMVRVNYNPSEKDQFDVRYTGQARWDNWDRGTCLSSDNPANAMQSATYPQQHTGTVRWTHVVTPNLLVNVGATLMQYVTSARHTTAGDNILEQLGFASSYYNQVQKTHQRVFPYVNLSGLPNANGYIPLGWPDLGGANVSHDLAFIPTVTWTHGAHTLRAGADVRFAQFGNPNGGTNEQYYFSSAFTNQFYNSSDAPGYSSGSSVAALLLGYPGSASASVAVYQFWSRHYFAPWVQDDWKITNKLTLNLGLRWDFQTPIVERHNKMNGIFNKDVVNPIGALIPADTTALGPNPVMMGGMEFPGVNGQPRTAYKMNKLQAQPRIGFAYALNNRMSIRGGIGESYLNDLSSNSSAGFSASTSYTNSLDNGITPYTATTGQGLSNPFPTFQQPTGSSLGYMQNLGQSFSFINPQLHVPSSWNYNLLFEIAPTRRDIVTLGYVGNRQPNELVSDNINLYSAQWKAQCDIESGGNRHLCDDPDKGYVANPYFGMPEFAASYYGTNPTLSKSIFTRPYPEFEDITEVGATNNGKHWFDSFQATAFHQMNHSLSLHATYVHEKSMNAGDWVDQLNGVKQRQLDATNTVNHMVTVSGVGYLPFGRNRLLFSNVNRVIDEIINGWEVSPLLNWQTGQAWNLGSNWESASTGEPVGKEMGVEHKILAPNATHSYQRIQGITPCVGTRDADTGAIIPGPAAVAAGCSEIKFVTSAGWYSKGRNNEDVGVSIPAFLKFDAAASKNFKIPGASKVYLSENASLQVRVDLFNVLNHSNWDEGYNNNPWSTNFGTIPKGPWGPTNLPRFLQLAARLTW